MRLINRVLALERNGACATQVMSLVNQLSGAEDQDAPHCADGQDAEALFHRAGLMLRLGKKVRSPLLAHQRLLSSQAKPCHVTGCRASMIILALTGHRVSVFGHQKGTLGVVDNTYMLSGDAYGSFTSIVKGALEYFLLQASGKRCMMCSDFHKYV